MNQSSSKLEHTRLAILQHLQQQQEDRRDSREQLQAKARMAVSPRSGSGRLTGLTDVSRNWWEHHPAHTVLELATPALSVYARRQPLKFLGIAAAAGALFMLARPWKLISLTSVVLALARSSYVTNAISAALAGGGGGGAQQDTAHADQAELEQQHHTTIE